MRGSHSTTFRSQLRSQKWSELGRSLCTLQHYVCTAVALCSERLCLAVMAAIGRSARHTEIFSHGDRLSIYCSARMPKLLPYTKPILYYILITAWFFEGPTCSYVDLGTGINVCEWVPRDAQKWSWIRCGLGAMCIVIRRLRLAKYAAFSSAVE